MVLAVGALDDWRFCPICGEAIEKVEDRAECRSLHEDEDPVDALRREIREETALELEPPDFLGFWLEPYDSRIVLCLAWTARVTGEPRAGDDLVELRWFEPDELPAASDLAFLHYPAVLSAALGRRDKHA